MAHKKILRSFSRLSERGNLFWESLFRKLINRQPATLTYFANVQRDSLYTMLSKSVTYVVLNSSTDTVQTSRYFTKVLDIHNEILKVPKSYVLEWRNCLIDTIVEFDKELTLDELSIWTNTIDMLIEPIGIEGE